MTPLLLALHLLSAPVDIAGETLFAEARYAAAAGVFESRWTADSSPAALVWAGRSRLRAGHAAHAAAHLAHALASELPPDLRELALADLARARARTHAVPVRLGLPASPGRLTVTARRTAAATPSLHHVVTPAPEVSAHLLVLALDAGPWTLELRRGGELLASHSLVVAADPPPVELAERPAAPQPAKPAKHRRPRLAIIGGAGSAALLITGTALLSHAKTSLWLAPVYPCPDVKCEPGFAQIFGLRSAGWGFVGASAGALAAGLTSLAPDRSRRRIAWASELALGAAAFTAGITVASVGGARFNADETPTIDPRWHNATLHTTGAAFMGLGAGLAATAIAGLVIDAVSDRRDLRATVTPTLTGVALTGRF